MPARGKTALTVEQVAAALRAKAGNITETARALGMNRSTLSVRVHKSALLRAVMQEEREVLVDIAELALRREVVAGNMTAIIWTLKASPAAKARGWSERQEITGADGEAVLIRLDK